MITVEIHTIQPGKCIWCGKERDDIVTLAFSDKSFTGPMCFADFKKALVMKVASASAQPAAKAATIPTPATNGPAAPK